MWSSTDLKWLKANYPGLKPKSDKVLEGRLSYKMLRSNGNYLINPPIDEIQRTDTPDYLYICDTYHIKIEWGDEKYPKSYEVGGKLKTVAKKLKKGTIDMHQYPQDDGLCIAAPMVLDRTFIKGFSLKNYIEDFLIPYLFAQTHYAKTEEWLWGDLGHGIWGLLEWLGRKSKPDKADIILTYLNLTKYGKIEQIKTILGSRCRNHKPCPCGSGKKTRKCHPEFPTAISLLRSGLSSGLIKPLN